MPPPILERLHNVRKRGTGWQACCPAHEDKTPSLSIDESDEGKILLKCHAGCSYASILEALSLTSEDVNGSNETLRARNTKRRISKTYDYTDSEGNLLYQTVRFDPKDFAQRRPHPSQPGEWLWNLQDTPRILYHWPVIVDAPLVYLVEGEKDVETLEALGLVATTNPLGAKKWTRAYTELLRGKTVILLPDDDQPGAEHMAHVARELQEVATVRLVRLPMPAGIRKGDVSDWVAAGGTREELEALTADSLKHAPILPPLPTSSKVLVPPLPTTVQCERPDWVTWLDDYAAHSATWAPRAASAYHKAVGLWVLSTIAARRLVCSMGAREVYPTLFLALIAPSGIWTKTEAATIGVKMLQRAGCAHLLAPDRTTPQFLLKFMSGIVPESYGHQSSEQQDHLKASLAFAAQRGWFYEEWGNMLKQMRRADSPQAELNKLLIVLEGGAETFETGTIQRGLERVVKPYLALLGCATPHDLSPFMGEGDAWWHDGFWPRFACVVPPLDATPSRTPRPRERHAIPGSLIVPLANWHARLGIPSISIEEERESNGKSTGKWQAITGALPCQTLDLAPDVYDAYEAYNDALLSLVQEGNVSPDLTAWYVRAHEKALRVAMLLTSLHGETTITQRYWQEGQVMVEEWRANIHHLCETVSAQAPLSQEARLEQRIVRLLAQHGPMSKRELQQGLSNIGSEVLVKTLASMVKIDQILTEVSGRRIMYLLYQDQAAND